MVSNYQIDQKSIDKVRGMLTAGNNEVVGTIRKCKRDRTFSIMPFKQQGKQTSHAISFPLKRYRIMFHTHPNSCRRNIDRKCSFDPPSAQDIVQMIEQYTQYGTPISVVFTVNGTYIIYFKTGSVCNQCKQIPDKITKLQNRLPPGPRFNSEYKKLFKCNCKSNKARCITLVHIKNIERTIIVD